MTAFEAMAHPAGQPPYVAPERGFAVAVVGEDGEAGEIEEAAVLAGGRIVARWTLEEAGAALAVLDEQAVVALAADGADADRLADAVPAIRSAAQERDLPLVVVMEPETIDVAVAALGDARADLLCRPTPGELVSALLVATGGLGAAMLWDRAREGEAERLRTLNEEVARIAEVLTRLSRQRDAVSRGDVSDRRLEFGTESPAPDAAAVRPHEVRQVIRARRLRDQFFGGGLFEDPAWDMLLDLFAAELEQARVSVSSLCIAAAVAPTTALRWISRMTEAGLLERQPDPFDRRRAFMALSERARGAMHGYVEAIRRAGLTLA